MWQIDSSEDWHSLFIDRTDARWVSLVSFDPTDFVISLHGDGHIRNTYLSTEKWTETAN